MAACQECNVEIEGNPALCPLCQTPLIPSKKSGRAKLNREHGSDQSSGRVRKQKVLRFMAWEIVSVLTVFILIILILTNLLSQLTISWAWLPAGSIILGWLLASFPLLLGKAPFRISLFSAVSVMCFFLYLDFIQNYAIDWFYIIAIPIFILVAVVTTVIIILSLKVKKRGINIAALILFGIGMIITGIDFIISYSLYNMISLGWSVFVIIPVGFTALFLLYIHYRISKAGDIRKWFQI